MVEVKKATVLYEGREVGTIAQNGTTVAFEYCDDWIQGGFSISPFSLPLKKDLFIGPREPFRGLFGVFDDLLPDGWGQLLTDRHLKAQGIEPSTVNMVTRLTLLSSDGMGALNFIPKQIDETTTGRKVDFDELKASCDKILKDKACSNLDLLFELGGSSGGARPKAYLKLDGASWIVKFPSSIDAPNIGEEEYRYNQCAKDCGLDVSETRLLPSSLCSGYFTTKRFDRDGGKRIHMVSLGGLLEASHRIPTLDYSYLFKVSAILAKGKKETEKIFRLMCFNELAHNWDDHAKNFAFLFDEEKGWRLSPAFDLTYSSSLGGEHATTINGKGKGVSQEDLLAVGSRFGLRRKEMREILEQIEAETKGRL